MTLDYSIDLNLWLLNTFDGTTLTEITNGVRFEPLLEKAQKVRLPKYRKYTPKLSQGENASIKEGKKLRKALTRGGIPVENSHTELGGIATDADPYSALVTVTRAQGEGYPSLKVSKTKTGFYEVLAKRKGNYRGSLTKTFSTKTFKSLVSNVKEELQVLGVL